MRVKFLIFILLIMRSISPYASGATGNSELDSILKNYHMDMNFLKGKANSINYDGRQFKLDDTNGNFYTQDKNGIKHPLEIYVNKEKLPQKEFVIFDPHAPAAQLRSNPLILIGTTNEQQNMLDDIVSVQRQFGIYSMKHDHPECYLAYAVNRLGAKGVEERLIALERASNPRPLVFESDKDWHEFKEDLKDLFHAFKGPQSYISIIGTSTTFFSENPRKGKNAPLFQSAPDCINRANDPIASLDVYTYDTPGNPSDIDIQLFMPELSDLCDKANAPGNNGQREVYSENTMDQCFRKSTDESVRSLVTPNSMGQYMSLLKSIVPEKALGQFYKKWDSKLKDPNGESREINFSVQIRPDQRKAPMTQPNNRDFENGPYSQGRFVIRVN